MIIESTRLAIKDIFSKRSASVVFKSIGLTLLVFIGFWFALDELFKHFIVPWLAGWTWVSSTLTWMIGAGIIFVTGFMLAPVTAIFAGLFLDDIASHIEQIHYPNDPPGKPTPIMASIGMALKFAFLVLILNLIAFILVFFAGFGVIIFYLVNGYLLGREYFVFAALRFNSEKDAHALRKKWSLEVFLAGLIVAFVISLPIINLLAPVFAAGLMIHLHKSLATKSRQPG